ncbi:MAG: response regulator transcription factor [Gemmatimonadaceae bacterium]|nr:response regulator transcription factor [Gemmatimonadaceae bacterium]
MRRVVIVEDEPLAREHLRALVERHEELELVGEAADGSHAVALIEAQRPDLVFLDIHLPELDGWQVLERLTQHPQLVLTTAFDHHAVHAFELGAVDYLLKPFGEARFKQAVARVLAHAAVEPSSLPTVLERAQVMHDATRRASPLEHLYVREGPRVVSVAVSDIVRLEADDDYVHVITTRGRHLMTMALGDLLTRLDGARFVRVHRSHAVSVPAIASLESLDAGRWVVTLRNGDRVTTSRSGTRALKDAQRDAQSARNRVGASSISLTTNDT